MSDLTELLYLVGLVPNLSTNQLMNQKGKENYVVEGERILSLARKKRIREPLVTINNASHITDFKYPTLDLNNAIASNQISNAIIRNIKNHFKNIADQESLVESGIPFLLKYSDLFNNQMICIAEKDYYWNLASEVSKDHLILSLHIRDSIFYLPCSPRRRFKDTSYFFKSDRKKTANMFHLEKAFYKIFLINWLNQLKLQAESSATLYQTLLYLTNDFTDHICTYNWTYDTSPLWLRHYLSKKLFKTDLNSNLIFNEINKSTQDYSNVKSPYLLNYLRIIQFLLGNAPFLLDELLVENNGQFNLYLSYEIEKYILYVLKYMIMDINDCNDETRHRKELNSAVARAYTTKKNIPEHIEKAMRNSELNENFGFIEFDEDVDLSLIDLITDEFKKINHNIFYDFKNRNIALRFRKLGRHHAKGLYYPSIGTMVVDIRYPDSFLHEYFHMIDDSLNNPSMDIQFSRVVEKYRALVIGEANNIKDKNTSFLFKKGKYNLNYYLRRCEIFARCGEIYLFRIHHVVSSLLKHEDTHDFAYPKDEKLDMLIGEFYEPLLKNLPNFQATKGEKHEANLCG